MTTYFYSADITLDCGQEKHFSGILERSKYINSKQEYSLAVDTIRDEIVDSLNYGDYIKSFSLVALNRL